MRSQLMVGIRGGLVGIAAACAPAVPAQAACGIFVTPIPNAPFSGTVRVERTDIQPEEKHRAVVVGAEDCAR